MKFKCSTYKIKCKQLDNRYLRNQYSLKTANMLHASRLKAELFSSSQIDKRGGSSWCASRLESWTVGERLELLVGCCLNMASQSIKLQVWV